MTKIVKIINNEPLVSTLDMYEGLGVAHTAIIKLIKKYINKFQEIKTFSFLNAKSTGGRPAEYCCLNEEQATFLITMMRNSDKVIEFKFKLTREFYRMRKILSDIASQSQNAAWLEKRNAGKLIRKVETDKIKDFVDYATNQGSQNAKKYYMNISKMENKALFFLEQKFKNIRDILNINQLSIISCADNIVEKALADGMQDKLHYKDIYKLAKKRVELFAEVHGKTVIPFQSKQIELIHNKGEK